MKPKMTTSPTAPTSMTMPALAGAALLVAAILAATLAATRWPLSAAPADSSARAGQRADAYLTLVRYVQDNPHDGRAWVLLAMAEKQRRQWAAAAQAFERATESSPKSAADPAIWCEWADAIARAQGGSLDGRPSELIEQALALDGAHPRALDMAGRAAYGRRDYAGAVEHWQRLLPLLEPASEPQVQLSAAIERAQRLAATSPPQPPR